MLKINNSLGFLNNPIIKSLSFFLPLVVITSGLKIYGYVLAFILFLPNIFYNRNRLIFFTRSKNFIDKLVIFYFAYLIFQTIIGAFYINDVRIIFFWIPFFIVTFYSYFNNIYDFKNDLFYQKNIISIVFLSCIFYFIFYILLTILSIFLYGSPFSVQENIWVGSSVAFFISSILFLCLFKKWEEISFKFDLRYLLLIIIHNLFITIHESRLGLLNLLFFGTFILIKCISLKKIMNGLLILTISFYSYSFFNSNIVYSSNYLKEDIILKTNYIDNSSLNAFANNKNEDERNIFTEFRLLIKKIKQSYSVLHEDQPIRGGSTRMAELIIAKNYFNNLSAYKKLFGTGWYTTRVTIKDTRNDFIDKNSDRFLCTDCLTKTDVTQLSGFIALVLDTGLVGTSITMILYLINVQILFSSNFDFIFKLFYFSMIFVNFLCLFIGYPLINIPFFLFFLPNRLIKN